MARLIFPAPRPVSSLLTEAGAGNQPTTMTDQEKIALLTLALAGAVGALEACETAFKHDGRHNTAKFCADLVVDYRKTLHITRP